MLRKVLIKTKCHYIKILYALYSSNIPNNQRLTHTYTHVNQVCNIEGNIEGMNKQPSPMPHISQSVIFCSYAHVHTCEYAHVHVGLCVCLCVHACTRAYVCVYMHAHVGLCVCLCVHACTCVYVCVYMHVYIYVCVCVYGNQESIIEGKH